MGTTSYKTIMISQSRKQIKGALLLSWTRSNKNAVSHILQDTIYNEKVANYQQLKIISELNNRKGT